MTNYIIETHNLTKKFKLQGKNKQIIALDKINLKVRRGKIFGLLGPNGAGKTTLIKILSTLIQPTSGTACINGYDILKYPKQVKRYISLMLESRMLYHRLTGYANLKFFCKIYDIKNYKQKIFDVTKELNLEKWLDQYVFEYSSGMKTKLALCRTFLLNREIMILDEPTLGLDINIKSYILDKLKSFKSLNKTIFLTTHDMKVVDNLCDDIAFINKGNIIKIGNKEDIKTLEKSKIKVEIKVENGIEQLVSDLKQQDFIFNLNINKKNIIVELKHRNHYNDLLSVLINHKISMIKEIIPPLDELFLKLI
ncbi:MAG: ABC transporter ATP-binding protein [Promethearchaeota archaeon]